MLKIMQIHANCWGREIAVCVVGREFVQATRNAKDLVHSTCLETFFLKNIHNFKDKDVGLEYNSPSLLETTAST